jgi:hypothetical protein
MVWDGVIPRLSPYPLADWQVPLPKADAGAIPMMPPNPQENCVGRSIFGGIAGDDTFPRLNHWHAPQRISSSNTGAGLGVMMGIFLGAMGDMSPAIPIVNGREAPQAPAMEQVRESGRAPYLLQRNADLRLRGNNP